MGVGLEMVPHLAGSFVQVVLFGQGEIGVRLLELESKLFSGALQPDNGTDKNDFNMKTRFKLNPTPIDVLGLKPFQIELKAFILSLKPFQSTSYDY